MAPTDKGSPSSNDLDRLAQEAGRSVLLFGLLLVVFTTLYPFQLEYSAPRNPVDSFSTTVSPVDLLTNIFLFVPFGFGVGCVLHSRRLRPVGMGLATLVLAAGLSGGVELLQMWYPTRTPSVSDLVANVSGGLLGALTFSLRGEEILRRILTAIQGIRVWTSGKGLALLFLVYSSLIVVISAYLAGGLGLENWDPSFPLMLGSEATPGRSWEGSIAELHIADRALSEQEAAAALSAPHPEQVIKEVLLVSYRFVGEGPYTDGAANLPPLVWNGGPPNLEGSERATLAGSHWLMTEGPAKRLADRLGETSEFTLILTLPDTSTDQWGPARIVSISRTPTDRNLLVGQAGEKLILRIRTPLTGANGAKPVVHVPAIFTEARPHRLLITYNQGRLRVYVDRVEQGRSVDLSPEVLFFRWALGSRWWRLRLGGASVVLYKLLYYGLLFVPCGWLLGLAAARRWRRYDRRAVATGLGIVLPTTVNEAVLATARDFKPQNLLLGLVFLVGGLAAAKAWEARATRRARRLSV
jgi:glycopeptide antibiotics resistance protein